VTMLGRHWPRAAIASRRPFRSAVAAALLGFVLGAAACGGSAPAHVASLGTTTTSHRSQTLTSATPYDEALRYSECMRAHGVGNFPDPDAQGNIRMSSSGSGVDARSAQYRAAAQACRKLAPATGDSISPPGAQLLPEWLKYSACMRDHRIVNFPDPTPIGNYGVIVQIPKSLHIDQSSPQFLTANKACQPLLKGNGPDGPDE
jgi:hypothetical protein